MYKLFQNLGEEAISAIDRTSDGDDGKVEFFSSTIQAFFQDDREILVTPLAIFLY